MSDTKKILLTQYSHGAGCGCKISPAVLDQILLEALPSPQFDNLLVGNKNRDDAAVFDLGNGQAVISTTDFFMPIVDDPKTFGRIAAVNAISDVYAMGGLPIMAIAILGWPIKDIPIEYANQVIEGGRAACADAGIPLAGGHSIDSPEPIFGLAVTGTAATKNLKKNKGAKVGDLLYLTKPIGVGILSTAQKKGLLKAAHQNLASDSMVQLNKIGAKLGACNYVHAMTDVTGFGLLGHLSEMCEASDVSATINFNSVPLLDKSSLYDYISQNAVPGGTDRNWDSYGHKIAQVSTLHKVILADPQTSGGLLVAVDPFAKEAFEEACKVEEQSIWKIGSIKQKFDHVIEVE